MADDARREPSAVHALKNHLAVIIGYSDLLLSEMSGDDPRRKDVTEIQIAATEALALVKGELKDRLS